MAAGESLDVLSLPASTVEAVSQPALQDAIEYFSPDLVVVPGSRNPTAETAIRHATRDQPILHPQLGRDGRVDHVRYTPATGPVEAADYDLEAEAIDILAVQRRDVLDRLERQLTANERATAPGAGTYLVVPRLSVETNTTTLSSRLPGAAHFSAISEALPEPLTVLAGGQPAAYHHEWSLGDERPSVPVAGLGGSTRSRSKFGQFTCTAAGTVAAEVVDADQFGLSALAGVGQTSANRLRTMGCRTRADVKHLSLEDLAGLAGIGRATAAKIHGHADVLASGEPLVLTNKSPVRTRDERPPVVLDIETDGLSPTIIWQFGVYDPVTDEFRAFIERDDPGDPASVLEEFLTWFVATHRDRTVLTWNGDAFDYRHIRLFLRQYLPEYLDAWEKLWTADLYRWAVLDGNALLPGRTNKLDHVARALGYESANTGLSGAQTAAAYQEFMRRPQDPAHEPEWDRHRAYCEEDCRALWHVYRAIKTADRRDVTASGRGGGAGRQAGLTDF